MNASIGRYLTFPLEEPIDLRRYERHATYVPEELIMERLSPQGYRPEILKARLDLSNRHDCIPLQELCTSKIRQGMTPTYGCDGPICLKPQHVRPLLIEAGDESRVAADFAKANPKGLVSCNVVLINRSGAVSLGRSGIYLGEDSVFLSEHVFACLTDSLKLDASFLTAYLNSWWGKRSLEAGIAGSTGQLQLSQSHVAALPIPHISMEFQVAIGNKVRKADRLRRIAETANLRFQRWLETATAQSKLSEFNRAFLEHVPARTCPDSTWVTDFDPADRVDPWPTHIAARTIRRHLLENSGRNFSSVARVVTSERDRCRPPVGPNCFFIGVLDVDPNGYVDWENAAKTRYESSGTIVMPGDVLYSTLNPQEPRCAVIDVSPHGQVACSPEFSIFRLSEAVQEFPYLVAALFRSDWFRVQASFLTRSSSLSRRRLDESDLLRIKLPWCEDDKTDLNQLLKSALSAHRESEALLQSAKSEVELLIDGRCDKEHLLQEGATIAAWLLANPIPNSSEAKLQ
jgi:type I restriction enzyme S subunit